jgi:N-acetylglucosaminyl-diphospho-decaprenol L-rhamnosyltransferase
VLVVDGASTDASEEIAKRHGADWLPRANRGLGFLYNCGAAVAATEYVLLANNDIALDARCLELLRGSLAADPSLFAADPRQLNWTGVRLVHGHVTLRRGRLFGELLPGLHLDQTGSAEAVVPTVMANGACMLVRRRRMLELGGFDETFFMDLEDLDLCWRAWLRGWGVVHVPDAWIRHRVGAVTTPEVLPRRLQSSHHNLVRFALKCLPAREAAVVVGGEIARMPRHGAIVGWALVAVARELPEILAFRAGHLNRRGVLETILAL